MTAVEWLVEQMKKCNMTVSVHNTSHQNVIDFYKAIEQAKEMEKLEKNNYICSKCKCSLDGKDMQQMQNKENT